MRSIFFVLPFHVYCQLKKEQRKKTATKWFELKNSIKAVLYWTPSSKNRNCNLKRKKGKKFLSLSNDKNLWHLWKAKLQKLATLGKVNRMAVIEFYNFLSHSLSLFLFFFVFYPIKLKIVHKDMWTRIEKPTLTQMLAEI